MQNRKMRYLKKYLIFFYLAKKMGLAGGQYIIKYSNEMQIMLNNN